MFATFNVYTFEMTLVDQLGHRNVNVNVFVCSLVAVMIGWLRPAVKGLDFLSSLISFCWWRVGSLMSFICCHS